MTGRRHKRVLCRSGGVGRAGLRGRLCTQRAARVGTSEGGHSVVELLVGV